MEETKKTFWQRWHDVILLCTIGFSLLVLSVWTNNKEISQHAGNIGTWVLAGGIVVWLLRSKR